MVKIKEHHIMANARILIVDDDPSIRKFIGANLDARGYAVLTAENGEEGVRMAEREAPDMIILDIMMPEMNGFEACRKIRKFSRVPILMLSAREGENDKEKCVELGANDYITKPFVLRDLLIRVQSLLIQ
jgi:DNA-binding response OmpR family regulator